MGQKASGHLPSHPSLQKTDRPLEEESRKEGVSAGQHVYLLQHREGPIGSQGLSHGPGTIIPDCVALQAVEARKSASAMVRMGVPSGGLNQYCGVSEAQGMRREVGGAADCCVPLLPTTQDLGTVGSFQCCSAVRIPSGSLSICLLTGNKVPWYLDNDN